MNVVGIPERSRETKEKLNENTHIIVSEISKLLKQSNRNSSSQEVLLKSAKQFSNQESCLENISTNLANINKLLTNIDSQAVLTCQSAEMTGDLRDKIDNIKRLLKQ